LSWQAIERLAARPEADLLVTRDGHLLPTEAGPRRARELFAAGCTLVLRHAERLDPELAELAAAFARDFAAPVNVHLYATPAGRHGFGWHYDAEEVFVVQAAGAKHYALRKNTLHPWPLVETLPADMGFEHEVTPAWECTLAPGDWLYLPSGTWHRAEAESDSLSLAIGLLPATALDVLDLLRTDLRRSIEWRQRLGLLGGNSIEAPEHTRDRLRALLGELAGDLARRLGDERFLERVLAGALDPAAGGHSPHALQAKPPTPPEGSSLV
jgi:ribosomal protein L16 Arg81 hydroxylase